MPNTLRALEVLLEPQERLDRLIGATFRRLGPRLVDLSYANPSEGPSAEVLDVLKRVTVERSGLSLQYTPYGGRTPTRRAIAIKLSQEYELPFTHYDVVMTSGAMSALNVACRALFGPEDEVIVLTPCWQDYPLYLRNLNVRSVFVALGKDKHLDLDAIARAIGGHTRGVLFSQPCCPTGVLYTKEEIVGLSKILSEAELRRNTRITVISDEVHRQLIWGPSAFCSPLQSYPRTLTIYSFGKALALQGQRIGYVAVSPRMPEGEQVRTNLKRCVRLMGFGTPTSLMQYAVCDLLDYQPDLATLAAKQAYVRRTLVEYGYDVCEGEASFYVYVKSPLRDDFRFAELLASRRVLVAPSTLFHDPGYIRLSLTAAFDAIRVGLPAFKHVLREISVEPHSTHCA